MIRLEALPELVDLGDQLVANLAADRISATIADEGGTRTQADTTLILQYKQDDYDAYAASAIAHGRTPIPITGPWEDGNNRPIAPFGSSKHNFGGARDYKITRVPAGMSIDDGYQQLGRVAEALGLVWGGRFTPPKTDVRHVELPQSITALRDEWNAYVDAGGGSDTTTSSSGSADGWALLLVAALGLALIALRKH